MLLTESLIFVKIYIKSDYSTRKIKQFTTQRTEINHESWFQWSIVALQCGWGEAIVSETAILGTLMAKFIFITHKTM